MEKNSLEERVFIIAPVGQDAHVMAELLARRGFETQICDSLKECCVQMKSGAGAFVLTEEALELGSSSDFFETLGAQPPWLVTAHHFHERRRIWVGPIARISRGSGRKCDSARTANCHYYVDTFSGGGAEFAPTAISGARSSRRAAAQ